MNNSFYDEKPKNDFEKPRNNYILRERGGCLSAFLSALIGLNTLAILSVCGLGRPLGGVPIILSFPILVVITLAIHGGVITCALAIWNWEKWGIYGLALVYVIQIALTLRAGDTPTVVSSIVGLLILLTLVKNRIEMFE